MACEPSNTRHLKGLGALCCSMLLLSNLPVASALHHMKLVAPQRSLKQTDNNTPLIVSNWCSDTIWPGFLTQSGFGPVSSGFALQSGESRNQTVSEDWQGRIWGRTNCTFDDNGNASEDGPTACGSGDCNAKLECVVSGNNPVTLAEFTLDAGDGQTYYDISMVDGYNLPMAIVLQPLGNSSIADLPPNRTNPSCQGTSGMLADKSFNPYDTQQLFLGTNSSYPLPFDRDVTDSQVSSWCPWNLQVNPPEKPGDGVYPYPDDNIQRPAFDPCYSACAKWNKDEDCCVGEHDSPGTCKPSDYSKAAKAICPDAYSYAFDDQTSTFIIPAGAGFEVVFCPSGRSTNILEMAGGGKTNNGGDSMLALGGQRVLGLLLATATNVFFISILF
ncbi:uncharacterized protein K452DRAFT_247970 [Aplosporella prunicola CBS 121167]|uniref:Osmotin, thaumatin-like protein n=1 Tax=Aplosporella prunicola CBS 121167 TaxID=1176127 RepID=A0A6A6BLH3_9PEZI|nr:uncharacterized protein K452DRAFT_247970 [Aplosporella prunicola CBS 121167]KAF2143421.1 hypothetical protein K452DRAFT_247970 [Aplosporella prunicola CBS 121167]